MCAYRIRISPTHAVDLDDYVAACTLAKQNAVYGGLVTDDHGHLLYAPYGEVAAAVLHHAKWVCDYIRDHEFVYGDAPINPAFNHDARIISCDRLVDWVMFRCGYEDQPVAHGECVCGPGLVDWCDRNGFIKITSGADLLPGDVVFTKPNAEGYPQHTFIYAGKADEAGLSYRYDAGSVARIRSTQPSCEPLNDFLVGYRSPALPS